MFEIATAHDLQKAIDAAYPSRVAFVRKLIEVYPWRFASIENGKSWVSQKTSGATGYTHTDRMLFELWFSHKVKTNYCQCTNPTLGKSISKCGSCGEWFK